MSKYWDSKKKGLLPWVKDWKDPQDQLRHSNNVRDMSYYDWFYCHPSAYSLIYYGSSSIYVIAAAIGSYLLFRNENYIFCAIIIAFMLYMTYELGQKTKNWPKIKDMTFYDTLMREY